MIAALTCYGVGVVTGIVLVCYVWARTERDVRRGGYITGTDLWLATSKDARLREASKLVSDDEGHLTVRKLP